MEFCDGGAVIDRLRSAKKPVLLISTLLDYSLQIAKVSEIAWLYLDYGL